MVLYTHTQSPTEHYDHIMIILIIKLYFMIRIEDIKNNEK